LSQALQGLHHLALLAWLQRAERASGVDKHDPTACDLNNHIGQVVAVQIGKTQHDRLQVTLRAKELRTQEDARMRGVSTWPLDDFDQSMQVDSLEYQVLLSYEIGGGNRLLLTNLFCY